MMIGFSLYADLLLEKVHWKHKKEWSLNFSSTLDILQCLKQEDVHSIELKIPATFSDDELKSALGVLNQLGFQFTFHAPGGLDYPEQFDEYSRRLQRIAQISEQNFSTSTFFVMHGLSRPQIKKAHLLNLTEEFLVRTQDALVNTLFQINLEVLRESTNNGKTRTGTSYSEVLELIQRPELKHVGICWDFGHSFAQAEQGIHSRIPPNDFLKRVKHTHIHDYKNDTTHIPLGNGTIPYQDYIQRLVQTGFSGIWNLELNPRRITDPENFKSYIIQSIRLIKLVLNGSEPDKK